MPDLVVWSQEEPDEISRLGTRFLVFPQAPYVPGYERPEPVWISTPLGAVRAGPSDDRLYVVDPLPGKAPYDYPYLPPFVGAVSPPVEPGPDGHFDHLAVGTREFMAAHSFACVRRMLDIAESYLGRPVPWFFAPTYERLEIVPHLEWDNAQSGFGFLELGQDDSLGEPFPFALNFDAIAHETGHMILFGAMGLPRWTAPGIDFLAYHETVADYLSMIGLLHFDTALDRILRRTRGQLMIVNELDRLAELTDEKSVRTASHSLKMGDVGNEVHDRSKPFTGALFDSFLDIHHLILVERGLSSLDIRDLDELRRDLTQDEIEAELAIPRADYELRHFAVKSALIEARDLIGETLAHSWSNLDADRFSFRDAAEAVVQAAAAGRARRFADRIFESFAWRQFF